MLINQDYFKSRKLLVVSKHKKEQVIAPIVEKELGVTVFTSQLFDTDSLGTFTGEINRQNSALNTVRKKCVEAMKLEGYDLAIAAEGSFGNHPNIFYACANEEIIMLKDLKNNIEIVEKVLSFVTNFGSARVNNKSELKNFLHRVDFPTHRIILKAAEKDFKNMVKGINNRKELMSHFYNFLPINGYCFIETDMRACYNPKRMKVIEEATLKLINKIKNVCPICSFPGYGIVDLAKGLPCGWCKSPTDSILYYVYKCANCHYRQKIMYPKGTKEEDPMYCNKCNP
ncbi:DUF6671 family protein [Flavobacterium oreochromis]|uniref:DUF6671 family protein n=1 Tax=Flavobacterium oreochromis TaxID=2906078 RepID=A0ABW8P6G7_9FLAO|nr:DUF6671 family protein [Flavobacterium oreochromis]OWP74611.1 hypothetical protein BWG23_13430 [Flavobacterium oreochromis]